MAGNNGNFRDGSHDWFHFHGTYRGYHPLVNTDFTEAQILKFDSLNDEHLYIASDTGNCYESVNGLPVPCSSTGGGAEWVFNTSTAASDPGIGTFRYDNSTLASVTNIYVSQTTQSGLDFTSLLTAIASTDKIYVQSNDNAAQSVIFSVTGSATDNGTWWTIPVTVDDSNTLHDNGDPCTFNIMYLGATPGAGGIYNGSGTIPTSTTATITDWVEWNYGVSDFFHMDGANGRFGINVIPTATLDVADSTAAIHLESTGSGSATINMTSTLGSSSFWLNGANSYFSNTGGFFINYSVGLDAQLQVLDTTSGTQTGSLTAHDLTLQDSSAATQVFLNADGDSYFTGGSLGIGTSTPSRRLEVFTSGDNYVLASTNVIGANTGFIMENSGAASNAWGIQRSNTSGNFSINHSTGATYGSATFTNKFTIEPSGDVGIGTSSPSTIPGFGGTTLEVSGVLSNIKVQNGANYGGVGIDGSNTYFLSQTGVKFHTDTILGIGGVSDFKWYTGATEIMRLTGSGQAQFTAGSSGAPGISFLGDTDTGIYQVSGNRLAVTAGGKYVQEWTYGGTHNKSVLYALNNGTIGNPILQFKNTLNNYTTDMYHSGATGTFIIEAWEAGVGYDEDIALNPVGGNVGIGTSSPAELLHVGTSLASEGAQIGNAFIGNWSTSTYAAFYHQAMSPATQYALIQSSAGVTYLNTNAGTSLNFRVGNTPAMVINSSLGLTMSAYGIHTFTGTSATYPAFTNVGVVIEKTAAELASELGASGGGLWVSSGTDIYNSNAGNVGVGIASPDAKFHVDGAHATSLLTQKVTNSGGTVAYTQYQTSTTGIVTGAGATNTGLTVGINGANGYVLLREPNALYLGTDDTIRVSILSNGDIGFAGVGANNFLWDASQSQLILEDHVYTDTNNLAITMRDNIPGISWDTETLGAFAIAANYATNNSTSFLYGTNSNNATNYMMHLNHLTGATGMNTSSPNYRLELSGTVGTVGVGVTSITTSNDTAFWSSGTVTGNLNILNGSHTVSGNLATSVSNSGTGNSVQNVTVANGGGDAYTAYTVSAVGTWSMGIDNSASDVFRIGYQNSPSSAVGAINISTGSDITLSAKTTTYPRLNMYSGFGYGLGVTAGSMDYYTQGAHNWYTGATASTQGVVRMTMASSGTLQINGNVGIGTAPTTYPLTVTGGTSYPIKVYGSSTSYIEIGDASLAGDSGLYLESSTSWAFDTLSNSSGTWDRYSNGTNAQTWSPGAAEKMRLTSTGFLGIGTTPSAKLHVNGGDAYIINPTLARVAVGNSLSAGFYGGVSFQASTSALILSNTTSGSFTSPQLVVAQDSGVGIGTATPGSELHLEGSAGVDLLIRTTGAASQPSLTLENSGDAADSWRVYRHHGGRFNISHSTQPYGADGDEFTILTNGNVGIGTASPSGKLHVDGNGANTYFYLDSGGAANIAAMVFQNSASRADIYLEGTSNDLVLRSLNGGTPEGIRIDYTTGYVGMGGISSPTLGLHVYSSIGFGNNGSGSRAALFSANSTGWSSPTTTGYNLTAFVGNGGSTSNQYYFTIGGGTTNATAGIHTELAFPRTFTPTSGTANHVGLWVRNTINQTGTATGRSWGILVQPIITAAADYTAIEVSDGAIELPVRTITATSYTAAHDYNILVDDDTAGSTVTITLPAASGHIGREYRIKKLGSTANVVVDGNGAETIDGATTATLTTQYESITIVCDGTAWWIV